MPSNTPSGNLITCIKCKRIEFVRLFVFGEGARCVDCVYVCLNVRTCDIPIFNKIIPYAHRTFELSQCVLVTIGLTNNIATADIDGTATAGANTTDHRIRCIRSTVFDLFRWTIIMIIVMIIVVVAVRRRLMAAARGAGVVLMHRTRT